MIIYKNFFKKRPISLVFERFLVLSKSYFSLTFFLSSFISIYKFFHFFIKSLLLISCYYTTHLISFIFIKKNWFKIFTIFRLVLITKFFLAFLYLLVKINEIRQFRNLFIIDIFGPNMLILLFKLVDFI